MNPLQSRKKMLIAESDLNRAQLIQNWQTMADDVHALTKQARTISSFASAAVSLVAGLVFFQRKKPAPATEKPFWLQAILNGAGLFRSLWSQFKPPCGGQKDK